MFVRQHGHDPAVHLGIYRFDGDPNELIPAYDRLMAGLPAEQVSFHACAVRPDGITIYDACPSEEAFRRWVSSPGLAEAFSSAGLPQPAISDVPVHAAMVDGVPFPAGPS
jgi:hypothetical protein